MQYTISRDGQQFGPYSPEAIEQFRREGRVGDTDLCWCEGMPGWQSVASVFGPSTGGPAPEPPPRVAPPPPAAMPPSAVASPPPPSLHWLLVMVLSVLTCGIFGWIWVFVQASWVRTFDPRSNAVVLYAVAIGGSLVGGFIAGFVGASNPEGGSALQLLVMLGGSITYIVANFKMRDSIEYQFTTVEPMHLSLSGIMTFFFGLVYFQYHLNRITEWKRTGGLQG